MARWSPERMVDVASEYLVGWRLLLEHGNAAERSVSAMQDNAGCGRKTSRRGYLVILDELIPLKYLSLALHVE